MPRRIQLATLRVAYWYSAPSRLNKTKPRVSNTSSRRSASGQLCRLPRMATPSRSTPAPGGALVGRKYTRVRAVILSLEQQFGHLPGPLVEQIGG